MCVDLLGNAWAIAILDININAQTILYRPNSAETVSLNKYRFIKTVAKSYAQNQLIFFIYTIDLLFIKSNL